MLLSFIDQTCFKGTATSPKRHKEVEQHSKEELYPDSLLSGVISPSEKACKTRKLSMSDSPSSSIVPHENDVLMGRGGKNNQHIGNEKLRELARQECENYRRSSKKGKSYISRALVMKVRELNPAGRFLKRNQMTSEWEDVGDEIAREKASQVLRDAVAGHTTGSASTDENPDLEPIQADLEQKLRDMQPERPELTASEVFNHSTSDVVVSRSFHFDRSRATTMSKDQDRPRSASTPITVGRGSFTNASRPHPDDFFPGELEYGTTSTPEKHDPRSEHRTSYPPVTPISTASNKKRRRRFSNPQSFSFDRYASTSTRTPDNPGVASVAGTTDPYSRHHPEYHRSRHPHNEYHDHHHQERRQPHLRQHHQPHQHQQHQQHRDQQHHRERDRHHQVQHRHQHQQRSHQYQEQTRHRLYQQQEHQRISRQHNQYHQHQHHQHQQRQQSKEHQQYHQQSQQHQQRQERQQHEQLQQHRRQEYHRGQHQHHQHYQEQQQHQQTSPRSRSFTTPSYHHYDAGNRSFDEQHHPHYQQGQVPAPQPAISAAISAESRDSVSSQGLLGEMQEHIGDMQENIGEFDLFDGELLEETNRDGTSRHSMKYHRRHF